MMNESNIVDHLLTWKNDIVPKYAHLNLVGNQALIEPYVLQKRMCGYDINFLVATAEAKIWYDKIEFFTDLDLFVQLKMINPGEIVFDLGANHGLYSVIFGKMAGPTGKVYAFDPFPINVEATRYNAVLNQLDIQVFECGLSSTVRQTFASASVQIISVNQEADSTPIKLDILDHYVHYNPTFVKIDIEGAEIDCLIGAQKLLQQRPKLHIELHTSFLPHFNRKAEEIFELINFEDYICYIQYPNMPIMRYRREFALEQHCALFLLHEEPVRRISLH